jgi:hypothetical protein
LTALIMSPNNGHPLISVVGRHPIGYLHFENIRMGIAAATMYLMPLRRK